MEWEDREQHWKLERRARGILSPALPRMPTRDGPSFCHPNVNCQASVFATSIPAVSKIIPQWFLIVSHACILRMAIMNPSMGLLTIKTTILGNISMTLPQGHLSRDQMGLLGDTAIVVSTTSIWRLHYALTLADRWAACQWLWRLSRETKLCRK